MQILTRDVPPRAAWALEQSGVHPLLARLFAARGVVSAEELDDCLGKLLATSTLSGAQAGAVLLADAIAAQKSLCIVADYDCDGATACAVAVRGLRMLGAQKVSYIVPDRVVDGYGLTAPISQRVKDMGADVLITVDNGIASLEGVAAAQALGLLVLVTDHHLPAEQLPSADVIVNPNQVGCPFESKSLAGVGVMFYVLLALRAELRMRGVFTAAQQPKLDSLLPLVALGTVADVVKLDGNNRRLVAQGLKRIRAGALPAGMASLFKAAGRETKNATTFDFGFALGPRINAAGRLSDMSLGIECLLTDDSARAEALAKTLDGINRERREIEGDMRQQALEIAESLFEEGEEPPPAICVFDPDFHEGVVGIVASRIKDKLHRPCFVFAASNAPGKSHELKGSGRSIPGFHLRDALDLVAKRHPGVLLRFGGHAMAAGFSVPADRIDELKAFLRERIEAQLGGEAPVPVLELDGALDAGGATSDLVEVIRRCGPFGAGNEEPRFAISAVRVAKADIVGMGHVRCFLVGENGTKLKAMAFREADSELGYALLNSEGALLHIAGTLRADNWNGRTGVQLVIEDAARA